MLTRGRDRVGLWVVLAAALVVSGCAAANSKGAGPAVLYHAPAGRGIGSVGVSGDAGHQWVVVAEASAAAHDGKTPPSFVTRYLRVDAATGKTRVLGEMSSSWPLPAVVSPDGQVAVADTPEEKKPFATRLVVLGPRGRWRTLVPLDDRFRTLEGWSPDSRRLLYERWEVSPAGRGAGSLVVAEVPAGKDSATETVVVRIGDKGEECRAVWSADGRTIYAAIGKPDGPLDLVAFAYPSLKRSTVAHVPMIFALTVAAESGDLVWLAPLSSEKGPPPLAAWRMPPGGAPVDTGLRLDKPVDLAAVSPDGQKLAVIQDRVTNLILYDLSSSSQQRILAHGETLGPAVWLSEGESMVHSEGEEVRRVPVQGPTSADEQMPGRKSSGD
jgi:Tol biopolymer transport system component